MIEQLDDEYREQYDETYADKHLYHKFAQSNPGKSLILSHRGGLVWGPENSMKVLRESKEQNVEAIEVDIWMSKDDVIMVMHGKGENGNLSQYDGLDEDDIVFRWTSEELRTIDIGEGETMPTLEEVFEYFDDRPDIIIYIDIKYPLD